MFTPHPSEALTQLFKERPYQGVNPEKARYLFVGLDANYSPTIETEPVFEKVIEYHADGVSFWEKYGVHHPFLLDDYSGDGRFYHQSFANIGFRPEHASEVSFVELLGVPTTGRNPLAVSDLDTQHLKWIDYCITRGSARYIFLSANVAKLMRQTKLFYWLSAKPSGQHFGLKTYFESKDKLIFQHLHFSNYGKFEVQKKREAMAINALIRLEAKFKSRRTVPLQYSRDVAS